MKDLLKLKELLIQGIILLIRQRQLFSPTFVRDWSLLVAKGAQIDQTPALPTKVKYNFVFLNKTLIFLIFDLFIQLCPCYLLT